MDTKRNTDLVNIAGIQLALFELVWPTFRWVDGLYMKAGSNTCAVHVISKNQPLKQEWDDCRKLLGEILDMAFEDSKIKAEILWQKETPPNSSFVKIMSHSIFEEIAREKAPWRLNVGR